MASVDFMLAAYISFSVDELHPLFLCDVCTHVKRTEKIKNN